MATQNYRLQYTGKDIDKVIGEMGNGLTKGLGNFSLVQTNKNLLGRGEQAENLNALQIQQTKRALGDYSAAFGYDTVAGCTGYYITEIGATELKKDNTLTITIKANEGEKPLQTTTWLASTLTDDKKDYVYIKLKWNYNHIGYISEINPEENKITITLTQDIKINPSSYDGLNGATNKFGLNDSKGESINMTTYQHSGDTFSIRVPTKPLGGKEILTSASYAIGYGTKATATGAHAEGVYSIAGGRYSHAEGQSTEAGQGAHAEGKNTQALGEQAHSEGMNTKALGDQSHAEGHGTIASGYMSHAENRFTQAIGQYSHAEGNYTVASGERSHAEGNHTKTTVADQHVQGKYNYLYNQGTVDENSGNDFAHIVGGGASDTDRKNIHTLDWDGNAWFAGKIQVGDVNNKVDLIDSNNLKEQLDKVEQTKQYLYDLEHAFVQATEYENDLKLGLAKFSDSKPDPEVKFGKINNKQGYEILTPSGKKITFDNPINITDSNKIGAWIYYDTTDTATHTITFEFNSKGKQDDDSDIEFRPTLKQGWNYYIYDFNHSNTERTGKINNVYGYLSKKGTTETLDLTNLNYLRIMEMTNKDKNGAFDKGTIYIGRVAVLTPEENQAIENTLKLQALETKINELEALVRELQNINVSV